MNRETIERIQNDSGKYADKDYEQYPELDTASREFIEAAYISGATSEANRAEGLLSEKDKEIERLKESLFKILDMSVDWDNEPGLPDIEGIWEIAKSALDG